MARIIGAIATSHTPTIGFAHDTNKQSDPVWKPIFDGYEPIRACLAEKRRGHHGVAGQREGGCRVILGRSATDPLARARSGQ